MRRQLLESTSLGNPRLDKERGIVRGVKILGLTSSHGYRYAPAAVRGAAKLYEGKAVNIDHPSDRSKLGVSRSYRDRFAKLLQIHYVEGNGLFGNLHYNRGHQLAKQFEWDVEHAPENLGLSHNASGRANRSGELVESIEEVRSVDIVADPATTMGLFEARGSRDYTPPVRTLTQVVGDTAYGVVANADIDVRQKRKLLLGLLDLFADAMEGSGDSSAEAAPTKVGDGGLAESRLLDLLCDSVRDGRRRLVEAKGPAKKMAFELRDLLN